MWSDENRILQDLIESGAKVVVTRSCPIVKLFFDGARAGMVIRPFTSHAAANDRPQPAPSKTESGIR